MTIIIREDIKSHNRLNLGNHPNLPKSWKKISLNGDFLLQVIIAKVRGWETSFIFC